MYESAINSYELSDSGEFLLNVEDIPESPNEIKGYIPKLMPNISLGKEAKDNIKIVTNPSIFVNAPDCKIQGIQSVINSQNYITVKPYPNQKPNFKNKLSNVQDDPRKPSKYMVKKHSKFLLEILHGDIGNMYFTDKI